MLRMKHTRPLAAQVVFDIFVLMSEEFNDFIFILLNNRFTLQDYVLKIFKDLGCGLHKVY